MKTLIWREVLENGLYPFHAEQIQTLQPAGLSMAASLCKQQSLRPSCSVLHNMAYCIQVVGGRPTHYTSCKAWVSVISSCGLARWVSILMLFSSPPARDLYLQFLQTEFCLTSQYVVCTWPGLWVLDSPGMRVCGLLIPTQVDCIRRTSCTTGTFTWPKSGGLR